MLVARCPRRSVDIGAPGSAVLSTVPGAQYASYSGTSMACPHVSGAAALYKAVYPQANYTQIRNAIFRSAVPTASLAGRVVTGGRLDVRAMLSIVPQ